MARSEHTGFVTIRTEGSFFTPGFLHAIFEKTGEGTQTADYHRDGEQLNEVISQSWTELRQIWRRCQTATTTFDTIAREKWFLPLFSRILGFGPMQKAASIKSGGRTYPISHSWNAVPIHFVRPANDLDTYAKVRGTGTTRQSPYSLVQSLLNSSEKAQWGIVSNGLYLRLLRSNRRLAHQAYIEFDLQAMMIGEHYPDFVLFWLLCHVSRFEQDATGECWLERWLRQSYQQSIRARDKLRDGVERAITVLGNGFLHHSTNQSLRDKLASGSLQPQHYYQQLLRLVYRLIILLVAEDRDVLCENGVPLAVHDRYERYYSISHLRTLSQKRVGTRHIDLFWCLCSVMTWLSGPVACSGLGLPVLNGFLFSHKAIPDLENCDLSNHDLLEAIRALTLISSVGAMHPIDYRNIGPEELGSIYETLLERHAVVDVDHRSFHLETAGGHERKTTGSYYTPDSLVQSLLDSALEPVLERACRESDPQAALLKLKVCDPACGSGHFF